MTTTQKGFIAPLILALVALLILGGGAYAYVQNEHANQPAVVTSTTNYFDIKEVGLKFKIMDDIKDLTYSIINQGNGATYVWFSTKTLENLGGKNCNSDQAPLGGIGVWQKDISGGEMAITYLIKSNNFSVTYGTHQSVCSSVKEAQDLQTKQAVSLSEALKTIVRTDSQTANWKIYTNTSKGYSIEYPVDARLDTSDLSCVRIDTKEFGSVAINVGSSNPCGDPTGLGVGMISSEDTITIASKQYPTSGYRESDNGFSFFDFNSPISEKISVTYGVSHFDKSNPDNWKNLGALTDSEYQNALNSAKEIVSTFKLN